MNTDFDSIYGDYKPPSALEKVAGSLRSIGHKASLIPFAGFYVAIPLTIISAVLDTMDGFFTKGFKTGVKTAISGAADTAVTSIVSSFSTIAGIIPVPTFWLVGNWLGAAATGDTLGEIARKGTRSALDSIISDSNAPKSPTQLAREMQVLGSNPMTIGAIPAAMGYAQLPQMQMQMPVNPATLAPVQPNQWRQMEAQRRGLTLEQADQQWVSNNREEAVALQRARGAPLQLSGA